MKDSIKEKSEFSKFLGIFIGGQYCPYYGFGLSLDTRDSNAYVSRTKRIRIAMRKLPHFQGQTL